MHVIIKKLHLFYADLVIMYFFASLQNYYIAVIVKMANLKCPDTLQLL